MRISLCIPTYNRAPQLWELLNSVVHQTGHALAVEIVISDNASTDDTTAVINDFTQAGLSIIYKRLPENIGFDRNMLKVVTLASSDYCWLFGSDDILEDGAFARIEQLFAHHKEPTGVSIGSNGYSTDLSSRIYLNDHISTDFPTETMLHGRDNIVAGIGPWGMGYISSIIIRRQAWNAAVESSPVEQYFNGYIQIYVLARALDDQSTWICIPDRLVGWRSGNDGAVTSNEFDRTRIDLVGFEQAFGDTLGRDNPVYWETMRKVATFYIKMHFLNAKISGASLRYWKQAIPMSIRYYWKIPAFWTNTFTIAIIPRHAILLMRFLYRSTIKDAHKKISF
ncbi:MAG: glycosyltransferase family 2 protein [Sphingomonas phyllosphaerae]|uniref:glycosyltransferase family 2 protein n=1 Tax=Sphingomonas phyllosphaerae TaxID=257003 RepID=UPI002FFBCF79